MNRREFMTGIGGAAAALPLSLHAQQQIMPVIGILATASPEANTDRMRAFREGLKAVGYMEGQNVGIEYRWADANSGRLPELAAELLYRKVAVLVAAGGTASALAAKAATASVPIVFGIGADPVGLGLVASLSRPGGNVTGVNSLNLEVVTKRLELLHELLPQATNMGLLVNPAVPALAEPAARLSRAAADAFGLQLHVLHAGSESEFDAVFDKLRQLHVDALNIAPDNLFTAHIEQLAALTVRRGLPAIFEFRRFVAAGGLMSYGTSEAEYYHLVGTYTGRILKGESPTDLPVQQATKLELLINLNTAKAMGLTIPVALLSRADEVIE